MVAYLMVQQSHLYDMLQHAYYDCEVPLLNAIHFLPRWPHKIVVSLILSLSHLFSRFLSFSVYEYYLT